MSKESSAYLVIKADRSMRIAKRPRIGPDEIAIRMFFKFPEGWGRVIADLTVDVPDFTPEVRYEQTEVAP